MKDAAASVRHRTEDLERASSSTWATLASESKGRDRFEEPDDVRTAFQQDRDRLLHASSFRRLSGKTRAHVVPEGDAPRSALTHTLEVAQIARTIGRALRLNEDLVEAIALGHDLGWPPFGSAGEEALDVVGVEAFRHHEQGLRVVERLERAGKGLNLTWEVRDGILHHDPSMGEPATVEGQVVRLADAIAEVTHGLADAQRAGLIAVADLPGEVVRTLGRTHGERVSTLVNDVISASADSPLAAHSRRMLDIVDRLRGFLDERARSRPTSREEQNRAVHCLRSLAVFYLENPGHLPAAHQSPDPAETRVVDHLSGITDREVLRRFDQIFTPRWPAGS